MSRYGEATDAGPDDQASLDAVRAALWPGRPGRRGWSDTDDAIHLATHLRARRDYFITTDTRILGAEAGLRGLGIQVAEPAEALRLARPIADRRPVPPMIPTQTSDCATISMHAAAREVSRAAK